MIHIYTGNGKGKTTASVGQAIRGAGAGMKVFFFQFMKNGNSSEISVLEKIGITVMCCHECNKFIFQMNEGEISAVKVSHNRMLDKAINIIESGSTDMIVLDEFFGAYNANLFDRELAGKVVSFDSGTEIILTGRNAPALFMDKADYITVMQKEKHPYNNGAGARKGIEY